MLLAAETADPGWAHLVGLMIAATIAFLGVWTHRWWMDYRGLSPTPPEDGEIDVTPGETVVSDDDDTDLDTTDDTDWEGRRIITMADGSRVVRYQHHAVDVADAAIDVDPEGDPEEETREEMADRLLPLIEAERCRYSDAVRELMGAFNIGEATAKRAIRDARERAGV
jgi:hypothetical protein